MKHIISISLSFFCLVQIFAQKTCVYAEQNFTGFCSEFYPNGKTQWIKEFKDGLAVGVWMHFDEKGNLIKQFNTNSKKDSLDKKYLIVWEELKPPQEEKSENLKINKVEEVVWIDCAEAIFPGGYDSLKLFVSRNMIYPPDAIDLDLQGTCYLKFIVEIDGTLTNITVLKGVPDCPECDKEAIQMLKKMPPWIPPKNKGKLIRTYQQLPINFTLK